MQVDFISETSILVDDVISVTRTDKGWKVEDVRISDNTKTVPAPKYDPKFYYNQDSNNLTIEESVDKAIDTIWYEIWGEVDPFVKSSDEEDDNEVAERAVRRLIEAGLGRDTAYRLAGAVKNSKDASPKLTLTALFNAASAAAVLDAEGR